MYINMRTYFDRLDINFDGKKSTLESITDETVQKAYINKLFQIYEALRDKSNKIDQTEDYMGKVLKTEDNLSLKAKIIIVENKIEEMNKTKEEEMEINIKKGLYNEAYESLKTKQGREKYVNSLIKQKMLYSDIQSIIEKDGEEPYQTLEVERTRTQNKPRDIKEKLSTVPEYNVDYEDEDITLCNLGGIVFENEWQFKQELSKYKMFIKLEGEHITIGLDFYSNIQISELDKKEYKIALLRAISQNMLEGKMYLGTIQKGENGYYIIEDGAEELAASENEIIQKEKRRENKLRRESTGAR